MSLAMRLAGRLGRPVQGLGLAALVVLAAEVREGACREWVSRRGAAAKTRPATRTTHCESLDMLSAGRSEERR